MKKITLFIALFLMVQLSNSQNSCSTAYHINAGGLFVVSGISGTEAPTIICTDNGANTGNASAGMWYAYTPTHNYTVTLSTDISQNTPRVDTRLHVYTGTCGNVSCYTGDDDSGLNYSSVCTFNVYANTTYIFVFDNKWTSNGFTFQLTENPFITPPVTPITYINQSISTLNTSDYNLSVSDMNGDSKDDITSINTNNLKIHYQNNTAGTFTVSNFPISGTSFMPSWSMAVGDCNRDGFGDIVLGNGNGLSIWRSNSTGTAYSNYTPGQYIFCQRTNFADLNNDGNLDVFSCHDIAPNCYYLNDSAGNFSFYQSSVTPGAMNFGTIGGNYSTLFTDFDNDLDSDVFISKCSGPPCELYRNDGNGVYTNISAIAQIDVTPIQTWSSAVADFDNDGDMDIIITASTGNHRFFKNNLDTTNTTEEAFTDITSGSGWDTNTATNIDNVAYDFDNNGFVDVLGGGNKIMFNQGNNTFSGSSFSGIAVGAIGDLNNDGFLDILNDTSIRYAVPNSNNWLKVSTQGVQSNRSGIGARVEIYGAWGKQIRDIRSGEGFKYMHSLNAHFGLGQATTINQVIIKWPSGVVDVFNNVPINQTLKAVEGSTLGIESFDNNAFSLYPVPAKNELNIKYKNQNIVMKNAEIFDLNGKLVFETNLTSTTININSLNTGTYILLLRDENNKNYSQKFIKQ